MSDTMIVHETAAGRTQPSPYLGARGVIFGAIAGAALATVLGTFGASIGLALGSTSPTWRDTSSALVLLTGLFLIFTSIVSFGVGGYIAGRALDPMALVGEEEEFRQGVNGLLSWGLATLITAVLALGAADIGSRTSSASSTAMNSAPGENLVAFDLDRLYRSDTPVEANIAYARSQAARILLTANSHAGMAAGDKDYLARLVVRQTGLSSSDAMHRVDEVVNASRQNVAHARSSAVIIAFMAAVAALIGAAVAWAAACAAARHRRGIGNSHLWMWNTAAPPLRPEPSA